jgi:tetratricopeptide (TPR) repeat protein
MTNPTLQRALLLHQQGRTADAERELRQSLAEDPHYWYPHALLALCLADQHRLQEATAEATAGISLDAEQPFAHYAMASVMRQRRRYGDAQEAIKEAIRLDAFDPDHLAMLAQIRFEQNAWPSALEAAERALELDGEHIAATNLRAMALVKLGRRDEANASLHGALARAPEDATTHSNQGWSHLHAGEHRKALEHFREALRLDPESEWAKAGVVEALKSRYFIYRWLLRYFLWMARLSSGTRWGIVIGGYIGYRALSRIATNNPDIAMYIWPVVIAYAVFALTSWLGPPLFNLLLHLNRFGRLALTRDQRISSIITGILLVLAFAMLIAAFTRSAVGYPLLLFMCIAGIMLTAMLFNCESGWPRLVMCGITIGVLALGLYATALEFLADSSQDASELILSDRLWMWFIYALLASQFAAMYLQSQRVRR